MHPYISGCSVLIQNLVNVVACNVFLQTVSYFLEQRWLAGYRLRAHLFTMSLICTTTNILCAAADVGMHGLLASQSCYHSVLPPSLCTLWTSSRFLHY